MLFNSLEFAVFLPVLFLLYWFVLNKNLKVQNTLLLIASYIFYSWWDWRYLFLLIFISLANYIIGIEIEKNNAGRKGKWWLITGLVINIGILCVFKYFNFFIDSFIDLISLTGYNLPKSTIKIILPLGISFYTFLSLSYIIDIYKQNLCSNKNLIQVLLSLGFFPILLAGPIQRPSTLLPQIAKQREFSYDLAADGLRQILWGLFAKIAIADRLSPYVDISIFPFFRSHTGSTLLLGAILFTVQIYADFSGYSNMAIGIGKLFGFRLMQNFAYPYFARDIAEYWKRWHISLTTWFRDYLFLPLSFNISSWIKTEKILFIRTDQFIYIVASSIIWLLTGLWHGPNYTFIFWGFLNGTLLILFHLQIKPRKRFLKKIGLNNNHLLVIIIETIFTLTFVIVAWIIFKSNSLTDAKIYLRIVFSKSLFSVPSIFPKLTILSTIFYFTIEWIGRGDPFALAQLGASWKRIFRWSFYYCLIISIFYFAGRQQGFIYFQF